MAKAQPPQKKPANLSVEQMRSGIARLQQRIDELNSFQIKNIYEAFDAAIASLRKKTNTTIQDIFGHESVEYEDYELLSFDYFDCSLDEVEQIRSHYREQLSSAALQLKALKELLEERVAHAAPSQDFSSPTPNTGKVFIVHGHDHGVKETVARFIENLGLEAIILHEQPNEGRTVIEKFEDNAVADFAIVLFTPDDIGHPAKKPDEAKPRARQNVVLELGFFIGSLSRKRVAVIHTGDVEIPSDYSGVLYLPFDGAGAWKFLLAKEMSACGMSIDMNKIC